MGLKNACLYIMSFFVDVLIAGFSSRFQGGNEAIEYHRL